MPATAPARRGRSGRSWTGNLLDVLIRPAEPADAVAIGAVWQRAALAGYEGIFPASAPAPTSEALAERSRQAIATQGYNTLVLVACTLGPERAVVGTIGALPDPDESTRAQIVRLYVDPGHWGRGIGRRLHDQALAHLEQAGYKVVFLWVLEANVRARAMYERWGWRATPGRLTMVPGVDEVCYLLAL